MNEEYISLDPTPEEMEESRNKARELREQQQRHQYGDTHEKCPNCGHYPLEEQTFGYEKSIFCSGCSYQRTVDVGDY